MGNHDFGKHGFGAEIFSAYFGFTKQAASSAPDNYSFQYGKAYFIVINSLDVSGQTQWLESELQRAENNGFAFKIVMFHIPVYNPRRGRNNVDAQTHWVPLFDKYKVDLVLTGHDHSYLRSKRLKAGKPVAEGDFGTTYVVATACNKFYQYESLSLAEKQFTDIATYQVVTLDAMEDGANFLKFSAHDLSGRIMDKFETSNR